MGIRVLAGFVAGAVTSMGGIALARSEPSTGGEASASPVSTTVEIEHTGIEPRRSMAISHRVGDSKRYAYEWTMAPELIGDDPLLTPMSFTSTLDLNAVISAIADDGTLTITLTVLSGETTTSEDNDFVREFLKPKPGESVVVEWSPKHGAPQSPMELISPQPTPGQSLTKTALQLFSQLLLAMPPESLGGGARWVTTMTSNVDGKNVVAWPASSSLLRANEQEFTLHTVSSSQQTQTGEDLQKVLANVAKRELLGSTELMVMSMTADTLIRQSWNSALPTYAKSSRVMCSSMQGTGAGDMKMITRLTFTTTLREIADSGSPAAQPAKPRSQPTHKPAKQPK